jgi:hypothetical protein
MYIKRLPQSQKNMQFRNLEINWDTNIKINNNVDLMCKGSQNNSVDIKTKL